MRIPDNAASRLLPIAISIRLGSESLDEQADFVDTIYPVSSNIWSIASAFIPGNEKLTICGAPVSVEFSTKLGIFLIPSISLTFNRESLFARSLLPSLVILIALDMPTMRGIFSVPDLLPPSWPPPAIKGNKVIPSLTNSNPIPFGPLNL
ncbi:hypothetical protein D3C75_925200 [compost metagenome]